MADMLNLGEVIQGFTRDDEKTLQVIDDLQGLYFMRAHHYSRTDARNAFFRIAEDDAVSIVSSHAKLEGSSVIMPVQTLAEMVTQVVHAAQEPRTSMASVFRTLQPLRESVRPLRLDADDEPHTLHVGEG
jgi:hypothetical protein